MNRPIFPWTEEREFSHQSDVEHLQALREQRSDLEAEIKKYSERIEISGDARSAATRAASQRREADALAEAKLTGKSVVFKDPDDGCEVTASPNGNIFYNAADWY